jgi:hypothetical protein
MNDINRCSDQPAERITPYVRGPGWPGIDDGPNPWSKRHWNLTHRGQIYKGDRAKAERLAQAAGHKNALSARFKNAK